MGQEDFFKIVKSAAARIKQLDKSQTLRLISHLDADGISAASIMVRALNRENMRYSISIVQQLNEEVIRGLSNEEYKTYIFTDLGSGQIDVLKQHLSDRQIFVIDHHIPQATDNSHNLVHVNPHLVGIDGSHEISGSGVSFFVAESLNEKNKDMAHIAIIGAIGDVQEDKGFKSLNDRILKTAIEQKKMSVERGLRFFGTETRPLHKILEYSSDPYIPGVSGSESGCIQFLQSLGISPMKKNGWKRLSDLSGDEQKKLVAGIIMKRQNETSPDDVLGNNYILLDEEPGSSFRNAKEFSTLLNACGRLGKTSYGIGVCLGDKQLKSKALKVLDEYKREIISALRWYEQEEGSGHVVKDNGYIIINTGENILPTIAGTFASILAKSDRLKKNTFVLSIARIDHHMTKASLRIAGYNPRDDIDIRSIIKEIADAVEGEAGGHKYAAGALFATDRTDEFIDFATRVLSRYYSEENFTE